MLGSGTIGNPWFRHTRSKMTKVGSDMNVLKWV